MKPFLLLSLLLVLSLQSYQAPNPDYTIERSPAWKKVIDFQLNSRDFSRNGEISYLLIDWQENEWTEEYNYRYCIRLNNENGVQNNSQLYFSFDPSYQKLVINKIHIHRGDKTIDQLKRGQIELMRNEQNADRLIYDGSWSALAILKDVRVGDILEYEITLRGKNPIWGKHVYSNHQLAYNQEVFELYKSTLVHADQHIQYQLIAGASEPSVSREGNLTRYEWHLKEVKPIFTDDKTPGWYAVFPAAEISSFKDWAEVKQWENQLFDFDIQTPLIDNFIKKEKFEASDDDLIRLIRFVQDDIRYLGMEMGIFSHKPHHPEEILDQRFGDCKDKSYLLAVLLRRIGVDAWPALVHTSIAKQLNDHVPSPFVFNHVIVKFRWKETDYWVDPTLSQQKGALEYLCFPQYAKALVVDDSAAGPEEIPEQDQDRIVINEHYWLTDSVSDVSYQVITNYYGNLANTKRSSHQNKSVYEIRDLYLNFYSAYFNSVRWANDSALTYRDYPEVNTFKITEEFYISSPWKKREESNPELYAVFEPFNLYEYLSYSKDQERNMPLALFHPVSAEHTISLHLPKHKNIGLENETDSIVNDAFRFIRLTETDNNTHIYRIHFLYETKTDHVPIENLAGYFEDYNDLSGLCDINLSWGMTDADRFRPFWAAIITAILFSLGAIMGLKMLYPLDLGTAPVLQKPLPFAGWLIIPVIGLYLTPVLVTYQLFQINFFNAQVWENSLAQQSGSMLASAPAYFFELLFNLTLIIFAVFLLILMNQKRSSFPVLYIAFRLFALAGILLDETVIAEKFGLSPDYSTLGREIIYAAIWIPYFYLSERVKDTFTCTFNEKQATSSDLVSAEEESPSFTPDAMS
ncbi:DUF3857 domain-containing protein [Gaoshiqia sp. Z1-71]|uniref:DUF3857 domain-containing protein n=1 Tax=Gaoshiqia hydrogeniformans TaxID=3290090 RepID=UPI003BF7F19B